jgi:hypothetical protein
MSLNRRAALQEFVANYVDAKRRVHDALAVLRMDMVRYPLISKTEPPEIEMLLACREAAKRAYDAFKEHEQNCTHCKARTKNYWARETWKKGRGESINKVRFALSDYRCARAAYWRAGGHTGQGSDHSCWNNWKIFAGGRY